MKYGIWLPEKSLGSQQWTGIARPNNPFYEKSVRDSCAFFFAIKKYEGENRRKHENKKNM